MNSKKNIQKKEERLNPNEIIAKRKEEISKSARSRPRKNSRKKVSQVIGVLEPKTGGILFGGYKIIVKRIDNGEIIKNLKPDLTGRFIFKLLNKEYINMIEKTVKIVILDQENNVVDERIISVPLPGKIRTMKFLLETPQLKSPILRFHQKRDKILYTNNITNLRNWVWLNRFLSKINVNKVPRWVNQSLKELNEAYFICMEIFAKKYDKIKHFIRLLSSPFPDIMKPTFLRQTNSNSQKIHGDSNLINPNKLFQIVNVGFLMEMYLGILNEKDLSRTESFIMNRFESIENFYTAVKNAYSGKIRAETIQNWLSFSVPDDYPKEKLYFPASSPQGPGEDIHHEDGFQDEDHFDREGIDLDELLDRPDSTFVKSKELRLCIEEYKREQRELWDRQRNALEAANNSNNAIEIVTPSIICANRDNEIEIHAKSGETFTHSSDVKLYFTNGYKNKFIVETSSWGSNVICVTLPAGLHTGRFHFGPTVPAFPNVKCQQTIHTSGLQDFHEILYGQGLIQEMVSLVDDLVPIVDSDEMRKKDITVIIEDPYEPTLDDLDLDNPAHLEIVQSPLVLMFSANSNTEELVVEACTDVEIYWKVNFDSDDDYRLVDEISLSRIKVNLLDGDETFMQNLPLEGTEILNEPGDRTLKLVAESKINGQICSTHEESINIDRFYALHSEFNTNRIRAGETVNFMLRRSCPEPEIDAILTSSNDTLINSPGIITFGSGITEISLPLNIGAVGCGDVVITAEAEDHLEDSATVLIFNTPQITSISPFLVRMCEDYRLEITGNCFARETGLNHVYLKKGSVEFELVIEDHQGNTLICTHSTDIHPGFYDVYVEHDGLVSEAALQKLEIRANSPVIETFTVSPQTILPCISYTITINWKVKNASYVTIKKGNETLSGFPRTRQSCGTMEDTTYSTTSVATTYSIQADPFEGNNNQPLSERRNIDVNEEIVSQYEQITFTNNTNALLAIFLHYVEDGSGYTDHFKGYINPNGNTLIVSLTNIACDYFDFSVVNIDKLLYDDLEANTEEYPGFNYVVYYGNDQLARIGYGNIEIHIYYD